MMKLAILLVVSVIAGQAYGDEPERIVGGSNANVGQFPHQISLRMSGSHICGGSIIDSTHIVTAAHCITPQQSALTVVTGATTLRAGDGQTHRIKCIQVHPSYNSRAQYPDNDIAIITLTAPITMSQTQRSINLASRDYSSGGGNAIVSGWGKTSTNSGVSQFLKYVAMRIMSVSECQARLGGTAVSQRQVCTFLGAGQGACQGDSGGPLISGNELIGVVSWGIPCAKGFPDVFTNVYYQRAFIQQSISRC